MINIDFSADIKKLKSAYHVSLQYIPPGSGSITIEDLKAAATSEEPTLVRLMKHLAKGGRLPKNRR